MLKRILQLLKDIDRNGYEGIGKPERLSGDLSSYWSRRIDDANRIVYRIDGEVVKIVQRQISAPAAPPRGCFLFCPYAELEPVTACFGYSASRANTARKKRPLLGNHPKRGRCHAYAVMGRICGQVQFFRP